MPTVYIGVKDGPLALEPERLWSLVAHMEGDGRTSIGHYWVEAFPLGVVELRWVPRGEAA